MADRAAWAERISALSEVEFKREMLRDALAELALARAHESRTSVWQLTRYVTTLREELAAAEERDIPPDPLNGRSVEDLIAEQCAAIEDPEFPAHLLEPLVVALTRRLGPAAMERLVRPTLRAVDGG